MDGGSAPRLNREAGMGMLLKWKHTLSETKDGYRLNMLAAEKTSAYVGGLVGGRVRWFERSAVQHVELRDGRAIVDVTKAYAKRRRLLEIPRNP